MGYSVHTLEMTETSAEKMTANQKLRAKTIINRQLHDMCHNTYYDSIPVDTICEMVIAAGLDPEVLHGIWCGREGKVQGHVGNGLFILVGWYKMEQSGRYEINAYLS